MVNRPRRRAGSAARRTASALLILFVPIAVTAEIRSTVDLGVYNTVLIADGEDPTASGTATADVEFAGIGDRMVRPLLQIRAVLIEVDGIATADFQVPRAEIKWRRQVGDSYTLRFTAGRSRLSWGDGVVLNAGDVINGALPAELDLSASTLRDETVWLLSAYLPLGAYAFLEPVLLVPGFAQDGSTVSAAGVQNTGAGARVQWKVRQIKMESGYIYRGGDRTHQPYLSMQGNLFLDWYGGVSLLDDTVTASGGAFALASGPRGGTWTFRVEGLVETDSEPVWFPELTWSPSELFSTFVRARIAGNSESANTTVGLNWLPSTGLGISLFGTLFETLSTEQTGAITAAVTYSY